jgi:uridine monophosphate synthetase
MRNQIRLMNDLLKLGILELGEFELKSTRSPFKINLRTKERGGPLIPDAIKAIAREMFSLLKKKKIKFDLVVGVPQAGEPFAEIISQLSGKPVLKLKKEGKGKKRKITGISEGNFSPDQVALLVDDVLTFGDSKKEAISVLREAGLIVSDLIVCINREQGGWEQLEKIDCKVYFVFSIFFVLIHSVSTGRISQQTHDEITTYIRTNRTAH